MAFKQATIIAVWAICAIGLTGAWGYYDLLPGDSQSTFRSVPSDTRIPMIGGKYQFLIFAHPSCPCTRVTFEQAAEFAALPNVEVTAVLSNVTPERVPPSTLNLLQANKIRWVVDSENRELQLFQAATSGQCLLFDPEGTLLFSGGITASRGHRGENGGLVAVRLALEGKKELSTFPVFGCAIVSD